MLFLDGVLDVAGQATLTAVEAAADGLGRSLESPVSYGTYFAPGRHDAASGVRLLTFDPACACLRWTGDVTPT